MTPKELRTALQELARDFPTRTGIAVVVGTHNYGEAAAIVDIGAVSKHILFEDYADLFNKLKEYAAQLHVKATAADREYESWGVAA